MPDSNNDDALLRNLVPLNTLSDHQLGKLLSRIKVEKAKKGAYLFREGDTDHQNVYLISGTVALLSGEKEIDLITSGTPTARFALAHQLPRKHSARAKSAVSFVRIDSRMLSGLLANSQQASYEVNEDLAPGKNDWMGLLLQSPVFQQIPPANLQRVMMRMEEISVSADDVIIRQGDEGDYFYLISQGLCRVSRQPAPDRPPVELAQLKAGQGFGEESLISGKPRGSTVTMMTDGTLARLSKRDFTELVKEHLSQTVTYEEGCKILEQGGLWLDVRAPEDYEEGHLPGALNLPFFSLRFQASSLASDRIYVLYGEELGQSATGAYLLKERGHETYVIGEDWHEIALKAGLRKSDPTSKLHNVIEFNREASAAAAEKVEAGAVQEEEAREVIEDLRNRLAETEQAYREQLQQKQAEAKSLKQTLSETTLQLEAKEQESRSTIAALENQIEQLRHNLAEAKQQLEDGKAVSKRENQLRKDISRLEDSLAQITRERIEAKKAADEAQQGRSRLESQLRTAQAEHEASQKALNNELAELREQLQASKAGQQRQVQQAEAETAALRDELSNLQSRLQELEGDREQLSAEKGQAEAETGRLRDELSHLQARLQQLEGDREQLSTEKGQADAEAGGLRDELSNLKSSLQELESERAQAYRELDELKSRMEGASSDAQEKIAVLEARLEQEHQTAQFLRRSLATAENAVEISDTCVAESESENHTLHKQLQEQQAEIQRLEAADETQRARLEELRLSLEASEQARLELASASEGNSQALEQEKLQLLADIEQARAEQAAREAEQQQALQQMGSERESLALQLAEIRAESQEREQAFKEQNDRQQTAIERLEKSLAETQTELQAQRASAQTGDVSAQELQEARNRIETLEKTIDELKEVQLEMEKNLSEDSAEERESLRSRLEEEQNKRKHFEELAGKADFLRREREVQETAVEMLTDDLEQLSNENEKLASERDALANQLAEMQAHFTELMDENVNLHTEMSDFKGQARESGEVEELLRQIDEMRDQADELEREREKSRVESGRMKKEIRELRSVIETYVDQMQDLRPVAPNEEITALRSELNMVRRQASDDLEQMRHRLAQAEQRSRVGDVREVGEAAALQAMRQELGSIQQALSEKEQMLSMSQAQCRSLEDSIEDRDKEVDQLKRKLELLLSKTGGLEVPSEELNAMGFKFDTVAALAESGRVSEISQAADEEERKRSKLGRLFRKS